MDQPSASSARAKNVSVAAEQGLTGPVLATLYVVAGLIPLGLAAWASPGTGGFWFELGAACAILAMSLLVLQFLSSGRYEFLSGRIGIDRTMGFHRIAAYGVVVLAILHPVAYTGTNVLVDATAAWAQLQGMAGSPRFRSGVVALALLLFLVGFATIRTKPHVRYEIWRASHGLVALLAVWA
jgi:predicted ferric reductase